MTRSLALLIALAATFAALAPAASAKSCGRGEIPWKLVGRPGCAPAPKPAATPPYVCLRQPLQPSVSGPE